MYRPQRSRKWLTGVSVIVFALACVRAKADATLLLEEPYGHFGAFTATGHAAVYMSRICADTPTVLRRCAQGETGIVISRYNRIAGYDWLAIPLVPYLYAVENPDEVPLFANPKLVAFLRNEYRKKYLKEIAPDLPDGEPPVGNWTQLVGSAYDRTLYGFTIETTAAQDDEFIRTYNSRPNNSRFNLLANNCADFAKGVINFYYPKTLHRNPIADLGITTPKEIAKLLVKFSNRHPELESSSLVVPQVPGLPRSTPVYGVSESLLKGKKYVIPILVLQPAAAGVLAVAYLGGGRFDPNQHVMVLDSGQELEPPLDSHQRREYESQLREVLYKVNPRLSTVRSEKDWTRLQATAEPKLDDDGRPVLQVRVGEDLIDVGVARGNILNNSTPPEVTEQLLAARLHTELHRSGDPRASASDIRSDWNLLRQVMPEDASQSRSVPLATLRP